MKALKSLLSVAFLIVAANAFSQNQRAMETELLKSFKRIDYWGSKKENTTTDVSDSVYKANDVFARKLLSFTGEPSTMKFSFNLFKTEPLNISSADDGLFRIYSWDTESGGTMHFFENVFQFKAGTKTNSELDTAMQEGDVRPSYYRVCSFRANNKTYYIATFLFIGSTKDRSEGVQIFAIENGRINKNVAIIKTKTGLHSKLSYDYNDTYGDPTIDRSVRFDPVKQIILNSLSG